MAGHRRMNVVLISTALAAACLSGCSRAEAPSPAGLSARPAPASSMAFRPGEVQHVPDPRTLLSAGLRKDLRFAADEDSECRQDKANDYIDRWTCYLFTPHRRTWDKDMTALDVELHHPALTQDATTYATRMFRTRETSRNTGDWESVPLGDEGLRSPLDGSSSGQSDVLFRVRNVTVLVSTATGDKDKADAATLSAEQRRRALRVASELARSIARLER
ncbi:MAG TPA: hypothetical protein VFV01_00515 [Spirillospora sp.]|nr:hypothetical protein [Spirillospora sp.]